MKSNCKKFSDSISPLTMPKSNKEIRALLDCLEADAESYINSLKAGENEHVTNFKNSVLPIIRKQGLIDPYEKQLEKYLRILEARTISLSHNFQASTNRLLNNIKEATLLGRYRSTMDTDMHFVVESLKVAYVDFSNLLMITSQFFFTLEAYCKILCALTCVKFALRFARSELIQHNECWKQLKRLTEKKNPYCETCVSYDTCTTKIDFKALSRIYCYSMKVRQIADYTSRLISFNILKSGLMEPPFVYFKRLESIFKENSLFYKCLEDDLPKIKARYVFGKSIAEELNSPFLWGDERKLKKSLENNKDSDFYNYLLGRFYYSKNRFDEAIEPLERAKKINPRNPDVWRLLGIIYDDKAKTKRDLERAIEHFRKARDLEPDNYEFILNLGILELAFGDFSSSIKSLSMATKHTRTVFDKCPIFCVLSEIYRSKGMLGKSEDYLKKSKEISESFTQSTLEWLKGFVEERVKLPQS